MNLEKTLAERGSKYGDYRVMCALIQSLKLYLHNSDRWGDMNGFQREALDMICTKIGRICNGDPDYDDNWRDIAGYATKVLEQLDNYCLTKTTL